MSRHGPDPDGIIVARLDGTARRHLQDQTDRQTAVAELIEIATEHRRGVGPRLRADLLTEAAGRMLGQHRHNELAGWAAPGASELLFAAGANRAAADLIADETAARLSISTRPGIGHRQGGAT